MLPDLLAPNLKLVVCGSAAGAASAARGLYYAGPGNKFWRTLAETGLTHRLFSPEEYRELLGCGIGLTDVVKGQSGADAAIDFGGADAAGLRQKVLRYAPRVLAFNGKKAAGVFLERSRVEYGIQGERIGGTAVFVAPSTSGLAQRWWDAGVWGVLARVVASSLG